MSCMLMNVLFGPRGSEHFPSTIEEFLTRISLWCNHWQCMCLYVVSRGYDCNGGQESYNRKCYFVFVVGGKKGVWDKFFENVFTSLERGWGIFSNNGDDCGSECRNLWCHRLCGSWRRNLRCHLVWVAPEIGPVDLQQWSQTDVRAYRHHEFTLLECHKGASGDSMVIGLCA